MQTAEDDMKDVAMPTDSNHAEKLHADGADSGSDRSAEKIARLAERIFGETVVKITAPGGKTRDSVRVHFEDRTVIASRRGTPDRLQREVAFLTNMAGSGAPVPEFLALDENTLFQSDLGMTRLTAEMSRRSESDQKALAAQVFESLWQIKDIVGGSDFFNEVKPIATANEWLVRFARQTDHIAKAFGIPAPDYDAAAMAQKLRLPARIFVKWDARPGNAALDANFQTHWFDWEDYGRRGGVEDFAFLIGDEFWPIDAETSLKLFGASSRLRVDAALPQLARFAMLCAAQRLRYIRKQWGEHGWISEGLAKRYDRIGGAKSLIGPLCNRAADFAELDPASRGLGPWFRDLADPTLWQTPET